MTLQELLNDITACFKDKNTPLDKIQVEFCIPSKTGSPTNLEYTGGYGSSGKDKKLIMTFQEK